MVDTEACLILGHLITQSTCASGERPCGHDAWHSSRVCGEHVACANHGSLSEFASCASCERVVDECFGVACGSSGGGHDVDEHVFGANCG